MALVFKRALAYLRTGLSSLTGSAGLRIGLAFRNRCCDLDLGQNGGDAAVNRMVTAFCRGVLERCSSVRCLGSIGRREYRATIAALPPFRSFLYSFRPN